VWKLSKAFQLSEYHAKLKTFEKSIGFFASDGAKPTKRPLRCSKFLICAPHTTQDENGYPFSEESS
jgi:hypothetical protein